LIKQEEGFKRLDAICSINKTITFNYTNTAEKLYFLQNSIHLHGNINDKIILGINPDENDKLESVDTSILAFKKYYQRVCIGTDEDYIKWIKEIVASQKEMSLLIMGHSLDVTDKDIIVELFNNAKEIVILHHNEEAKKSLVKNLIRIFGYEEFCAMRNEKILLFMSTDSDFTEFKNTRKAKQYKECEKNMNIDECSDRGERIEVI